MYSFRSPRLGGWSGPERLVPVRQVDFEAFAGPGGSAAGDFVLHVHQAEIERVAGVEAGFNPADLRPLPFMQTRGFPAVCLHAGA